MRLLPAAAALLTAAALPLAVAACTTGSPPAPDAADGPPSAAPSPANPDTGLLTGYCYAWTVRTLDNVGNYTDYSVSGYFIDSSRTVGSLQE